MGKGGPSILNDSTAFLHDFRGPGLPELLQKLQKRLLGISVFFSVKTYAPKLVFLDFCVILGVILEPWGAPKGGINFQVFFMCLEGPRDRFGTTFGVILGSFWVSFLMFFGDVSGLFPGCPDLLGFCFWGAFWGAFRCVFSVSSPCFLSVCSLRVCSLRVFSRCVLSVCSLCVFSLCVFFLCFFALLAGFSSPCSLCEFCVFCVFFVCVCVLSVCSLGVFSLCSLGVFSRCVLSVFFLCVLSAFSVCVFSLCSLGFLFLFCLCVL